MRHFAIEYSAVFCHDKQLLNAIDLSMEKGATHVLMGPNGSGKSTLALALMGHPAYKTNGVVYLDNCRIDELPVHKRAQAGLFLSFQQPQEIPGVPLRSFLKASYEALHKQIDLQELQTRVMRYLDLLELDQAFYWRNLHEGFSGGQKKKLELLQLLLLKPKVAILDEIDSGLDVDALRVVSHALSVARQENPEMSVLLITHYQRMLNYIQPDKVHLLVSGSIVRSGDMHLVHEIEQHGYDKVF